LGSKQWDFYNGEWAEKGLYTFRRPPEGAFDLVPWGEDTRYDSVTGVGVTMPVGNDTGFTTGGVQIKIYFGMMYTTKDPIMDPEMVPYCLAAENLAHQWMRSISPFTENPKHWKAITDWLGKAAGKVAPIAGKILLAGAKAALPAAMAML